MKKILILALVLLLTFTPLCANGKSTNAQQTEYYDLAFHAQNFTMGNYTPAIGTSVLLYRWIENSTGFDIIDYENKTNESGDVVFTHMEAGTYGLFKGAMGSGHVILTSNMTMNLTFSIPPPLPPPCMKIYLFRVLDMNKNPLVGANVDIYTNEHTFSSVSNDTGIVTAFGGWPLDYIAVHATYSGSENKSIMIYPGYGTIPSNATDIIIPTIGPTPELNIPPIWSALLIGILLVAFVGRRRL